MKRLIDDELLKRQLLSRYLWPSMDFACGPDHPLTVDFARTAKRFEVVKYEHFELPGPSAEGYAYLFEQSLSHSYFHHAATGGEQGVRIHRPQGLIVQAESLLQGEDRLAGLQALEPGGLLRIAYPQLRRLAKNHSILHEAIQRLALRQDRYYRRLSQYLAMPLEQRFLQFREQHKTLLHRLPQRIQALHINVSRSEFNNLLKKFGGNG